MEEVEAQGGDGLRSSPVRLSLHLEEVEAGTEVEEVCYIQSTKVRLERASMGFRIQQLTCKMASALKLSK